jgi:hypothetical protein
MYMIILLRSKQQNYQSVEQSDDIECLKKSHYIDLFIYYCFDTLNVTVEGK